MTENCQIRKMKFLSELHILPQNDSYLWLEFNQIWHSGSQIIQVALWSFSDLKTDIYYF